MGIKYQLLVLLQYGPRTNKKFGFELKPTTLMITYRERYTLPTIGIGALFAWYFHHSQTPWFSPSSTTFPLLLVNKTFIRERTLTNVHSDLLCIVSFGPYYIFLQLRIWCNSLSAFYLYTIAKKEHNSHALGMNWLFWTVGMYLVKLKEGLSVLTK